MKFNLNSLNWEDFNFNEGWEKKFKGDVRNIINAALWHAKKKRSLDREAVAREMEEITGVKFTVNGINKWTRHDGRGHRFAYEYALPLAKVTGDPRIIMFVAESAGLKVLTPIEMVGLEVSKARERELLDEIKDIKRIVKDLKRPSIIKRLFQKNREVK